MNNKIIFVFMFLYLFFMSCSSAFASLTPLPAPNAPLDQRDKYQTDLYTGGASYTYKINVPKGTDDLTPDVSLSYNSLGSKDLNQRNGNGWTLDQDYVERDANNTPGELGDDKFKLHFQGQTYDLVFVAGDGRYHTKIESFLRIDKLQSGSNTYGDYWIITTTDGTKYRMGYGTGSELGCYNRSYAAKWFVDLVTDAHGNNIYYTYGENTGTGESHLTKIEYNTEKSRVIDFTYTTSPFGRKYTSQGCTNVLEDSRLSSILVKANTTVLVHQYDFAYSTADDGQQLLTSITEKGSDGSSSLPPTTFEYKPEVKRINTSSNTFINNANIDVNLEKPDVVLADVNGDSLLDIVRTEKDAGANNYDTWKVLINQGNDSWSTSFETWLNHVDMNAWLDKPDTRLIDVTGDGLPDVVRSEVNSGDNSKASYFVWKNTGSSWNSTKETWINNQTMPARLDATDTTLSDINGDGLVDIVRSRLDSGVRKYDVYFNSGSSWTTTGTQWSSGGIDVGFDNTGVRLQDVNGDGLPDLLKTFNSGGSNATWYVYKNKGDSWETTAETWINNANVNAWIGQVDLVTDDINGDGLTDIVKSVDNGGQDQWIALINKGNSWSTTWQNWIFTGDNVDVSFEANTKMADVTGDGLPDIIHTTYSGSNDTWYVWKNNQGPANLLSAIRNPQGGVISFDYEKAAVYDNTGTDSLPDLPFPLWVVKKMTVDNGMSGALHTSDVTNYSYKDGFYDAGDKEFRGFAEVSTTEPNGAKKKYLFKQDDGLKGRLYQEQTSDSSDNLYSRTDYDWSSSLSNGIYTVKLDAKKDYTYDGVGSNPKINETDYTYDSYGNVLKRSEKGDTSINTDDRFIYHEYTASTSGWIVNTLKHTYTNASNDSTKVSEAWLYYDGHNGVDDVPEKGDLTKETKWLSGGTNTSTQYTYDGYGNKTQVTDPNNHSTSYAYDSSTHTYALTETNAKSQSTGYTYDLGTGNMLTKTDSNGFVTTYTYDAFGRKLKEIKPYDSTTYPTLSYTYYDATSSARGILISQREVSSSSGTLNTYTFFDGLGRKIQTRADAQDTSKQIVVDTLYNPLGKVYLETVPHLDNLDSSYAATVSGVRNTRFSYDPVGRVTTTINPKGTSKTTAYDHWKTTYTDENSHVKSEHYNAFGKIKQVDEINGGNTYTTTYSYDSLDNLTGITDAHNHSWTFVYDTLGRKTSETDPDRGTWDYGYDAAGNQTSVEDNRNITTTKTYDELNRITAVNYPTDTDISYTYDGNSKVGTLTSVTDAAGTLSFTYDNRLRKTQEQRVTDGITWTTAYTYDALDRVKTTTKPDSEVVTNTFNAQGEIASASGVLNNIDYNALNKITSKSFPNTLTQNYTYNTDDFRLNRIQTGSVQDSSYTYDNVGNVSTLTNNLTSKTQYFGYDPLDRLTQASESAGFNFTYGYDSIGNMTSSTGFGSTKSYTYGTSSLVHTAATMSANTVIFDDTLANGWTNASFNTINGSTASLQNVYSGSVAMVSSLGGNGGTDFQAPVGMTTNGSDTLHFALKASEQGQQYQVYIDSVFGQPLATPVNLTSYGGQPSPDVWKVYNIPLSDLGATNVSIGDIVILNPNATEQPAVYIDDVKLSNGNPSSLTNSIAEDWAIGEINTAKWNDWGTPQTSVNSNQLRITSTLASGYYGLDSAASGKIFDLTSSSVTDQLVSAGNQSLNSWEAFPIILYKDSNTSYALHFMVSNNTIYARYATPSATTTITSTAYNSTNHKYFRIRESGGTIYWDTSANGLTWNNFTSIANPFDVTALRVGILAGTWNSEGSTTYAAFDNLNLVPYTPATNSIKDDWASGNINGSVWNDWSSGKASVASNQLKINSTTSSGYYGIDTASAGTQNFTNSYVSNKLIDAGNQSLNSWESYPLIVTKADAVNNQFLFLVSGNNLYAKKGVSGTYTTLQSGGYNSTNHKYFRIREISGTVYYETSSDGKNWTSFTSTATPFDITGVTVGMEGGTWNTEGSTTSAKFDDFNTLPPIRAAQIRNDWSSGSIDSRYWNNWGTPQTSVVSSQLRITSTLASGYYGLDSSSFGNPVDLTGSSVVNQVISAGNQSLTSWEAFPVVVYKDSDTSYALYFFISGNNIIARYSTPGGTTTVATTAYNSTDHKYFRVRENKGTIYWDTSANGISWNNFTSVANPFDITSVRVGMLAGTWNSEGSTTYATFDNFNILP